MSYTKNQHFSVLAETTSAVIPFMDAVAYADIKQAALRTSISPSMERGLKRRREGLLLRPLLVRMCYELTGGQAWLEQVPIMASVELLNLSTYQSNYCFDEKAGINTASEKNNQFICSMLTVSKAVSVLESFMEATNTPKAGMVSLLAKSNHEVYLGQFQDINVLNLDNVGNFRSLDDFLPMYLSRCDLIAGSTFRACAAGAMVNDTSSEILNTLFTYLSQLGIAAQMVNDLGDFIPHTTKDYATPFSDFRLGRLTLPIFLLQKAGFPLDRWRRHLRKNGHLKPIETALVEAIKDLEVESMVRGVIKKYAFPKIKSCLSILETTFGPNRSSAFRFAYPYIFDSRLLRYFRKDAKRAWSEDKEA